MWAKIKLMLAVLKKGKELADPAGWKNTQVMTNVIASVITAALASFAPGWDLSEGTILLVSGVISGVLAIINIYFTYATSKKVGVQ